jgi:hypothetical protein
MGLISVLIASSFVAASNLFMRRSIDAGGTTRAFLVIQMAIGFLVAFLIGPVKSGLYEMNGSIAVLGLGAGLVLGAMLLVLGKALEKGPPGLTFSILSGATVLPAIVMALLFGSAFGFVYTVWHGIGSILVVAGLLWAGRGLQGLQDRTAWVLFSLLMFSLHVLLLVIFQWRAMLHNIPNPEEVIGFFTSEQIRSQWFMPMLYLGGTGVQLVNYLMNEKRVPNSKEWVNGFGGGVANSLGTFFLIQGTELATGLENAVIFPLFSIGTIILSNVWSQRLYQEKVNWRAAQVCALGLLIGTVDWKGVLAAVGF